MNVIPVQKTNIWYGINKISLLKWAIQNIIAAIWLIWLWVMVYKNNFDDLVPVLLWPLFWTFLGTTTAKIHKRTCNHIQKFWRIDESFFIKVIWSDSGDTIIWYCQLQGMYLAAKKYKKEGEFFMLKKSIPII